MQWIPGASQNPGTGAGSGSWQPPHSTALIHEQQQTNLPGAGTESSMEILPKKPPCWRPGLVAAGRRQAGSYARWLTFRGEPRQSAELGPGKLQPTASSSWRENRSKWFLFFFSLPFFLFFLFFPGPSQGIAPPRPLSGYCWGLVNAKGGSWCCACREGLSTWVWRRGASNGNLHGGSLPISWQGAAGLHSLLSRQDYLGGRKRRCHMLL